MKMNKKSLVFMGMATLVLFFAACKKSTPPTVKIYDAISTTYTSANVTGEVTDEGSSAVTERGFIYGKQGETRQDTMYCGSGVGEFPTRLTGLEPNTTYNCFAFAKNDGSIGTSGKVTFTTRDHDLPTLTTSEVENVGTTTASCGGNVEDDGGAEITERGVCWSISHSPTTSGSHASAGSGLGEFYCNMNNLSANTTYYVRAYAKNSKGVGYGEEKSFTTLDFDYPEVTTANVTDITQTSAKGGGNVTSGGGTTVTERGICWSTSHNPTINDHKIPSGQGTGSFTANITGLSAHTTYYVRAYATNSKGTAYGTEVSFNTSANLPTVSTGSVTNITTTSAAGSGNVTNDGGSTVTERGLCWSTNHQPTTSGTYAAAGGGTGNFSVTMTNLNANTTYYVRAYATNGMGTVYGDEVEFSTLSISVPGVTTASVTNIGSTSATGGGNVISTGGATVTERGICWSMSHNPTLSGNSASSGTGIGSYTVNMTGLTPNTTYYVRAYAINSQGTAYGDEVSFQTSTINNPTVTTNNVSSITNNTATCGGNVTSDGGATVTARGVCWSTSQNPTLENCLNHTTNGSGTGSFTSQITGLTQGTTYYVRAYATNSAGTGYGAQKTFTTNSVNLPTVTTNNVTNVTQNTAVCGGNVTNDGGGTVIERGVCWAMTPNPTINNYCTNDGSGTGSFTSNLNGLIANKTYYVRAYAKNSAGTSYGDTKTFTTSSGQTGTWLFYDDGTYATNVGIGDATATIYWASMFPTSTLSPYVGTSLRKVALYENSYNTNPVTVSIYLGGTTAPGTLVSTQTFTPTGGTAFHEITLNTAVTISGTQNLWIVMSEVGDFPATACVDTGYPNNRWVSLDGSTWQDLDEALPGYGWMIRGWVSNSKGETSYIELKPNENRPQVAVNNKTIILH